MIGIVILTVVLAACFALICGVSQWIANGIWEDILEGNS